MEPVAPEGVNAPELPDGARRKFVHRMLNMTLGLWAMSGVAGGAYVAGQYVWPRKEAGTTGGEREVSFPVADLDAKGMVKVLVEGDPVGVFRDDDEVRAVGLVCPHLGCLVNWNKDGREMVCPCHGSRFDSHGAVLQGPSPAPLKRYEARVAGDTVVVT